MLESMSQRIPLTFRNQENDRTKGKRTYRQRVEAEKLADEEIEEFELEQEDFPDDTDLLQTY